MFSESKIAHESSKAALGMVLSFTLALAACGGAESVEQRQQTLSSLKVVVGTFPFAGQAAAALQQGDQIRMQAWGTFGSSSTESIVSGSATWSSSDTAVATVNGNFVTAVGTGTAKIRANLDGFTAEATVLVDIAPDFISIEPLGAFDLGSALSQQFKAVATYAGYIVVDVTGDVQWTSTNEDVLTFDLGFDFGPGFAYFHASGTTTIAATPAVGPAGAAMIELTGNAPPGDPCFGCWD